MDKSHNNDKYLNEGEEVKYREELLLKYAMQFPALVNSIIEGGKQQWDSYTEHDKQITMDCPFSSALSS